MAHSSTADVIGATVRKRTEGEEEVNEEKEKEEEGQREKIHEEPANLCRRDVQGRGGRGEGGTLQCVWSAPAS